MLIPSTLPGMEAAHPPHPRTPYAPLIVNAAITGMVASRERVPSLPVTVEQIARDARVAYHLGASVIHLHARDDAGRPDWRPGAYAEIIGAVRAECPDAVVCASTSGREHGEIERRAAVLGLEGDAKPDMASLTLGSLDFATGPSVNAPATVEALAGRMLAAGIRPELEVFGSAMASEAHRLINRGLVREPLYANLILGGHHTAPATIRELSHLVDSLPPGTVWAAGGIGDYQLKANAMAAFAGGHIRTGLEDSARLRPGDPEPTTNSALIGRAVALGALAGRRVATPAEARALLALPDRKGPCYRLRPARLPEDRESMLSVLESANMHRVPSPEMDDFDVGEWFVAEVEGRVVGVAGHRVLRDGPGLAGKTTLLAVLPDQRELGIGRALQSLRMDLMRDAGATRVITNADRPETIAWYERHFGYHRVGEVEKLHEFGLPDVDRWTTLEAPLV
jgi:3-keto-5-aminohexanoate cleavage enzyme